jgi:hypothetical protein
LHLDGPSSSISILLGLNFRKSSFSHACSFAYSSLVEMDGLLPVTAVVEIVVKAVRRQLLLVSKSALEGVFSESFLQELKEAIVNANRKSFFIIVYVKSRAQIYCIPL